MTDRYALPMMGSAREQLEELLSQHAPYIHPAGFGFTEERQHEELLRHILDHKYLTNERIPFEITLEQALFSWYENVFAPLTRAMDEVYLESYFPEVAPGELFLRVARHWHFLKQEQGRYIGPEAAVRDYGERFGNGVFTRVLYRLRHLAA